MLAEIYDRCTEGFDTPDLKDAKTLFGEFSRVAPCSRQLRGKCCEKNRSENVYQSLVNRLREVSDESRARCGAGRTCHFAVFAFGSGRVRKVLN